MNDIEGCAHAQTKTQKGWADCKIANNTMRYFKFKDGSTMEINTVPGTPKNKALMSSGEGAILPSGKTYEFWFGRDLEDVTIEPSTTINREYLDREGTQ
jgi:hypothetical protein